MFVLSCTSRKNDVMDFNITLKKMFLLMLSLVSVVSVIEKNYIHVHLTKISLIDQ